MPDTESRAKRRAPFSPEEAVVDAERKRGVCRVNVQIDFKNHKSELLLKVHASLEVQALFDEVKCYMQEKLHYNESAHGKFRIMYNNRALKCFQSLKEQADVSKEISTWVYFEEDPA